MQWRIEHLQPATKTTHKQRHIHPVDRHVGGRLRQFRSLQGLTQEQLAARIGIIFQQIQKYENGTNRLSCSRLYEIARELNVPIPDFFEGCSGLPAPGAGGDETAPPVPTDLRSRLHLVQLYGQIDGRMGIALLHLLRAVIRGSV
jgi:transcriptional regulator with XRE-family HTH domain